MPDDLGRDIHSVQRLMAAHNTFQNDLYALERPLQVRVQYICYMQI